MKPRVVALIVNYNRPDDTIACVRSLLDCSYPHVRTLLIDNGSTDDSLARFRRELPDMELHALQHNGGFTGGTIVGFNLLRHDPPEYLLLLNNDTVVEKDFLEPLVAALENDKSIAAAGGLICYHPEKERIWYGGGEFRFWRGSGFSLGYGQLRSAFPMKDVSEVTFITGCLMLLRTEIMLRIGFLDDRFCMYLEDAELSLRMIAAGYRLVCVRESRIYHKVHHEGNKPLPLYFSVRNRLLLLELHFRGWRRLTGTAYVLLTMGVKMVKWRFTRKDLFQASLFGITDYFTNHFHEGRGLTFRPQ